MLTNHRFGLGGLHPVDGVSAVHNQPLAGSGYWPVQRQQRHPVRAAVDIRNIDQPCLQDRHNPVQPAHTHAGSSATTVTTRAAATGRAASTAGLNPGPKPKS